MHLVKDGGSGTTTFDPGAAEPWAAAFSQWLNWSLVMTVSPILATPLGGTPPPQPAIRAAQAAMGSAMRRIRGMGKERVAAVEMGQTHTGARPEVTIVATRRLRNAKKARWRPAGSPRPPRRRLGNAPPPPAGPAPRSWSGPTRRQPPAARP